MRGGVKWTGDTIWADFRHFELPGSTGRARGCVRWGDDRPIRYDVRVHSDSVSLADIHWIHETLPVSGVGSMDLHIKNERDLSVIDYAITNMDVRSTGSRLRGAMTYGVGAPVLIVKDVNLELAPLDFALLETLNGGRFSLPWKGRLTGTARARGGPVDRFPWTTPACSSPTATCRATSPAARRAGRSTFSIPATSSSTGCRSTWRASTCARRSSSTRGFPG